MPLTEIEELKQLLKQPLPGGRGFQEARRKRMEYLHNRILDGLVTNIVDVNGARDLAIMWLEAVTGTQTEQLCIVENKEFQEIWNDYNPEDDKESK